MAASTLIGEVGGYPALLFIHVILAGAGRLAAGLPPEDRPDRLAFARFLRERANAGARGDVAWPTALPRSRISGA